MAVTVKYHNSSNPDWGFSILITLGKRRVLFSFLTRKEVEFYPPKHFQNLMFKFNPVCLCIKILHRVMTINVLR